MPYCASSGSSASTALGIIRLASEVIQFADRLRRWVPRPKPQVFRITKTNHNILQGIAAQDRHFTRDQQREIYEWVVDNAQRFWLRDGGPLAPRSRGGADCIVVDGTPQFLSLKVR